MSIDINHIAVILKFPLQGICLVGIKNGNIKMCSLKGETIEDMQLRSWRILNEFNSLFSNYQIDYIEDRDVFESMFK